MTLRLQHLPRILSTVALASPLGCGGQAKSPAIPPPASGSPVALGADAEGFDDGDGGDAERTQDLAAFIAANYKKTETRIPMRDGTQLFTTIYAPKHRDTPAPMMLFRTPYGVAPYGEELRKLSLIHI